MTPINIRFTRFSAFYSPLIMAIAGGFLEDEGLAPTHGTAAPGTSAIAGLLDGSVQVAQSAVSQGFAPLERGETPAAAHFAQINEMDGFMLVGHDPDPEFTWAKLAGKRVIVDHGGQPMAMFKYACHRSGLDFARIDAVDAGGSNAMIEAFRAGEGDYVHLQGPAPQQIERDGAGHIVTALGPAIGACAFSSLAATPEWLAGEQAPAFMRAYAKARVHLIDAPAAEIARAEQSFFPDVHPEALTRAIAFYQGLGNWSRHVEITRPAFEASLDIFLHAGRITRRHDYDALVVAPPKG
ncbi:MAG: ABC transporter substrate-binding protein [Alphaproteobacteria bacterium]|jgi:NitT/TauT family transport system substrate-binding protein|nr:ABC transporter substrate-binding protein [Alphaproteobacteria bacterium]MDP6518197.1 ABC transporter substrate-binding protein [Alphaproteobacteria bacterium]